MHCSNCGNEFEGKFCPECGAPAQQVNIPEQPFAQQSTPQQYPTTPQKKKTGCLKIALIVFAVICFLVIIISIVGNKNANSSSPANSQSIKGNISSQESQEPQKTYIEVTASTLLNDYDENGVAADTNYKDQYLKVTGTIDKIDKDVLDSAYVTLKNDDDPYSFVSVQCYFREDNLDVISTLHSGDVITISGRCDGSTLNVVLKDCNVEN